MENNSSSKGLLLVRFSVRGAEIRGEIVFVGGASEVARKIIFIDGYRSESADRYRGRLPKNDEVWVCRFVRDTQPGARKGAVIVTLVTIPNWDFVPTGKEEMGEKEFALRCRELPELSTEYVTKAAYDACNARNAAFKAAQERTARFRNALWIDPDFLKEFGQPTVARVDEKVMLTFGLGVKTVDARNAAYIFPTTPTGEWREDSGGVIRAARSFENIPGLLYWTEVAYVATSVPWVQAECFRSLPLSTQEEILVFLRTQVRTPEKVAADRFVEASRPDGHVGKRVAEIRKDIRNLRGPSSSFRVIEQTHKGGDVLSPDERGWRSTSWTTRSLIAFAYPSERSWHLGRPTLMADVYLSVEDVETAGEDLSLLRDRVVTRLRQDVRKEFSQELERFGAPKIDPRISSLPSEEWVARHGVEWSRLVDEWIVTAEAEDAVLIAAAHEEWKRYDKAAIELRSLREQGYAVARRLDAKRVKHENFHDGKTIGDATLDELKSAIEGWKSWVVTAEEAIARELHARGEAEIAAEASKEAAALAFEVAMNAPATSTRWFVGQYFAIEKLEKSLGRKAGEGLGLRVSGKSFFLPGDRGLVALRFGKTGRRRCSESVASVGLVSLYGGELPTSVPCRDDLEFLGIVEDPNWHVRSTEFLDGVPRGYFFVNASGSARLSPGGEDFDDSFSSRDWDGVEGAGPTEAEVRKAHGLSPVRPVRHYEESVCVQPSVAAPAREKPPIAEPVVEIPLVVFTWVAKRDFKCPKGHMMRLTTSEFAQYQAGTPTPIVCTACKMRGEVKK